MYRLTHRRTIICLVLLGSALSGESAYLQGKAWLAQQLLALSWAQYDSAAHRAVKPWPWADIHAIAELRVPRLNIKQYIMDNASGEALAFGAGWLAPSKQPGEGGHTLLAGHRDTHFAFLEALRVGDVLLIDNHHGTPRQYRVQHMQVIDSQHTPRISIDPQSNRLTLITCYPFDALTAGGSLRYVIDAVAI